MNLYIILLRYYYLKMTIAYNLIINRSKKKLNRKYDIVFFFSIFAIGFPPPPSLMYLYTQRLSGNI